MIPGLPKGTILVSCEDGREMYKLTRDLEVNESFGPEHFEPLGDSKVLTALSLPPRECIMLGPNYVHTKNGWWPHDRGDS